MSLEIKFAKPNPLGKDKTSFGTPKPEQLLGEWVDIVNVGNHPIRISTIALHHTLFNDRCQSMQRTENYWTGDGAGFLQVGQTLRVHTGRKRDESLLQQSSVDRGAVEWRGFANLDRFVLNNRCGDVIYVTWRDGGGVAFQDRASYSNNPPEGVVLKRVGSELIPLR